MTIYDKFSEQEIADALDNPVTRYLAKRIEHLEKTLTLSEKNNG